MMRVAYAALTLQLFAFSASAAVIGTIDDDFLDFSGVYDVPVITTFTNPYSGRVVSINGIYNVSNTTYDGLAGEDTLVATNLNELLLLESGGVQQFFSVEVFLMGEGNDVLNLASSLVVVGPLLLFGGAGNDLVWGNAGADSLFGSSGDDDLDGGPGDDFLQGYTGSNRLYGGSGFDTAGFNFAFNQYSITALGGVEYQITHIPTGAVDYLNSVEQATFSDQTIALPYTVPEPATWLIGVPACLCAAIARKRARKPASAG